MTRFFRSGAGALVVHLVSSVLLAAAVSPWVFRAGKAFAAAFPPLENPAGLRQGIVSWCSSKLEKHDFDRFFDRTLLLCALLLIPFLIRRLRRCPKTGSAESQLVPLRPKSRRILHLVTGLLLAGGLLWGLGELLQIAGAFEPKENRGFPRWISKALIPAISAGAIEEWLFRGLILGLWLRALPAGRAALGCSLLFAAVHFLQPPEDWSSSDGASPFAGFQLLGAVARHWLDPLFFFGEFLALFLIGLILAAVRIRTRSLWLPVGLHAGWILAFKSFNLFHRRVPMDDFPPLWVGGDLRSGIGPIATLLLTAALLAVFLSREERIA